MNYLKGFSFICLHYLNYLKYFWERRSVVKRYMKLKEKKEMSLDKYITELVLLSDELFTIEKRNENISQVVFKLGNGIIV